ncbi:hypothetical protein H3H37_25190 [Duganella sp. LX20W]|uniref:Uncharacterized protein n=1 Tax=Rugamonas brunnea TaxID=2758569 RepID=A0A7W2EXE0_9BURK|nr:hypothetical protein [Rugamonas brunnea]MBA5640358.1 hypothetical protein [Rugamonas brunnea]
MNLEQLKIGIYVGRAISWVKDLFKRPQLPQLQVSDSTNVTNVSGNHGSTINIGSISAEGGATRVHSNLAKPKLTFHETSYSATIGQNEYTFTMKNLGGDVLTAEVQANDKAVGSFARLPRGGSQTFKVHNFSRSELLRVHVAGFDVNGDKVSLFYTAKSLAGKFTFDNP